MENIINGSYEDFSEEITNLDAVIYHFKQYTEIKDANSDNSLYCCAETEDFCYFHDGKPDTFVKFVLYIIMGSINDNSLPQGLLFNQNNDVNLKDYCFYLDYFRINPNDISVITCQLQSCSLMKNLACKKWCSKCHGNFLSASSIFKLLYSNKKFVELPKNSIISIQKITYPIDYQNMDSLRKVQKFLDYDKRKIDIIKSIIDNAEEKIKKITEIIQFEKRYNQKKMEKIISIRGGSMDKYMETIEMINQMVNQVN